MTQTSSMSYIEFIYVLYLHTDETMIYDLQYFYK